MFYNYKKLQSLCLVLLLALLSACSSISPLPANYVVAGNESRTFQTPDKLTLFGQWWLPAKGREPRAVVLLVHGTLVHSGFYAPWAEELANNGYAVFGIDLRGWGQSQGFGRRGGVRDYDDYVADVELAWQEVKQRFPQQPVYLQGESMGGAVVLLAEESGKFQARGLILNAPAIRPNPGIGFLRAPGVWGDFNFWLASLPGRALPNMPTIPGRVLESGISLILKDRSAQQRYKADANNVHTALPYSYISALYKGSKRARNNLGKINVPLIVLQGTSDVMVPASSSEDAMAKFGSTDKTLKLYEGATHATLHDIDRIKVWPDIISWLNAHTAESEVAAAGAPPAP